MTDPTDPHDDLQAQAVGWVVRTGDPEFVDWPAFEAWLSAGPANADAYHAAAAAEAEMVELLANARTAPVPMPAPAPVRPWRPAPWLGALAASLVLALGYEVIRPGAPPVVYETAPGVHREAVLADGTRVALNGATRLVVDASDPRAVRLARGEALFTVRHDAVHPFAVSVADATVEDVGTVFDVVREAGVTRVDVAEGGVVWNPRSDAVRLDAGHGLRVVDGEGAIALARVDAGAVGGWSRGQLSYTGVPLATVAADLSRALGVPITVAPSAAALPVRGVLRLDGGADAVLPRLGVLLDVVVRREGRGWRLSAPT